MLLIDAFNHLVEDGVSDNHRYFAELYKLFGFRDEQNLKDYFDFILHEPLHWLRGFPIKLTTKTSFSKPKTAVIKLLKKDAVICSLGHEYCKSVFDTVWNTYKKHHSEILVERKKKTEATRNSERELPDFDVQSFESLQVPPNVRSVATRSHHSLLSSVEVVGHPTNRSGSSEPSASSNEISKIDALKRIILALAEDLPAGSGQAIKIMLDSF
jgi:hypothetical protein